MSKILSISIAAYNAENFIRETLESLVVPEIMDDIEVFIVDDGGNDHTLEIAQEFADQYPDTFIPVHKENGGYGSTVNYSIKHAKGTYFKLLDGDDWYDKAGLKKLVTFLKENHPADAIVTYYYKGSNPTDLKLCDFNGEGYGEPVYVRDLQKNYLIGMWALTYRTQILRDCRLHMPEHMLYTDRCYSSIPFTKAETIQFLDFPVYCYRIGRDEQSVSKSSRIKHAKETFLVCKRLARYCQEHRNNPNYQYLLHRISAYYQGAYKTWLLFPRDEKYQQGMKRYDQEIREIAPDVYAHAETIGKTGKLLSLFRRTNYLAYWPFKLLPDSMSSWD